MEEQRFNLVDEPWVRVRTSENDIREVSLTQALLQAHAFADLAGETATQDVAVFRLLLAVLHTVFSRMDDTGEPVPIASKGEALRRWQAIWKLGQLPQKPIEDYLNQWRQRFWLFDPERPFFQTEEAKRRTPNPYDVAKMNGELVESGNKARFFTSRTEEGKTTLSCAEATRWLLYLNGWDDNAIKPSQEAKNRTGIKSAPLGWLSELGYIEVVGNSLFETLMLNLTLLRDGVELWDMADCKPSWEGEPCQRELNKIPMPNHPAALLTMQYRRIKLEAENGVVCRYYVYSGDLISSTNAFAEQNTLWHRMKGKGGGPDVWIPRTHDPARQLWRDFSAIASQNDSNRIPQNEGSPSPGVVKWVNVLVGNKKIPKDYLVRLRIIANHYDGKFSKTVDDMFSDQLTLHADLLTELGIIWRKRIEEEILDCDKGAKACGILAMELKLAAGAKESKQVARSTRKTWVQHGEALFYDAIDQPFRIWLAGLSAQQNRVEMVEQCDAWRQKACDIGLKLGKQLVDEAGPAAFVGRAVEKANQKGKKTQSGGKVYYAAPDSYQKYRRKIKKIFQEREGNGR
jgi:CRISPR system Cascade subunit CasA